MLTASSRTRERVTATVTLPPTLETTLMSTPSRSAAIDTTVKPAASLVIGATTISGMICNERSAADTKADDEPRDKLERTQPLDWLSVPSTAAQTRSDQRQAHDRRSQHEHPHQLDQRANLRADQSGRDGGGKHLGDCVDSEPRQNSVLRSRQMQQWNEQGKPEHHQYPEDRREGNRRRALPLPGPVKDIYAVACG
jgi:hypothetical protein